MSESPYCSYGNKIYFICGVSGSGKSTIGQALSDILAIPFYDGDDFHPADNVAKMKSGLPLDDTDRKGWLQAMNQFILKTESGLIIACSALKEMYRIQLSEDIERQIHWIFLDGSFDLIYKRITSRTHHFMPPSLLHSQFEILDIPEYAIRCDINNTVEQIIDTIIKESKS
jgi:carbohydrate kinase (thermoresistant glucokinase family)